MLAFSCSEEGREVRQPFLTAGHQSEAQMLTTEEFASLLTVGNRPAVNGPPDANGQVTNAARHRTTSASSGDTTISSIPLEQPDRSELITSHTSKGEEKWLRRHNFILWGEITRRSSTSSSRMDLCCSRCSCHGISQVALDPQPLPPEPPEARLQMVSAVLAHDIAFAAIAAEAGAGRWGGDDQQRDRPTGAETAGRRFLRGQVPGPLPSP